MPQMILQYACLNEEEVAKRKAWLLKESGKYMTLTVLRDVGLNVEATFELSGTSRHDAEWAIKYLIEKSFSFYDNKKGFLYRMTAIQVTGLLDIVENSYPVGGRR